MWWMINITFCLSVCAAHFFSWSTALHLRMGSRTASWGEWMKVSTSSSPEKSQRWIPSKSRTLYLYLLSGVQKYVCLCKVLWLPFYLLDNKSRPYVFSLDVPWRVQSLMMERRRRAREGSWTSSNDPPNLTNQIRRINQRSQRRITWLLCHRVCHQPLQVQHQPSPSLKSPPHQSWQSRAHLWSPSPGISRTILVFRVPVCLSRSNNLCHRPRDASSRSQATDYSSSSDRSEESRTPDSIDEPWEGSDGRGSPQGGRRYPGVQMMGSGLLAEMKAKHERRAHKVRRWGLGSKEKNKAYFNIRVCECGNKECKYTGVFWKII